MNDLGRFTCACGWSGESDELVDHNEDGNFDQCPRCKENGLLEEEEDD